MWRQLSHLPRSMRIAAAAQQCALQRGYIALPHPLALTAEYEVRCSTTPMKCSARFSQVRASLRVWAPDGSTTPPIPWATARWARWWPRPRGLRPCRGAARQARVRHSTASRSTARTCAVHEEILLRKPFGQLKHFAREGVDKRAAAADRRADVGPLCDAAARHGRADAAELRRLHHRLARREAGAAVGRQLRSRRLYRLSDRVPRA